MENLILHAFNYQENDKENNIEFKLWCKNRESETVLLKLRGFYNYFFFHVVVLAAGRIEIPRDAEFLNTRYAADSGWFFRTFFCSVSPYFR